MERQAILVNDAAYAVRFLQPLLAGPDGSLSTLVLCPPKLSLRVGKWLSNRQRLQWQRTWADGVRADLVAAIPQIAELPIDWIVAPTRLKETTGRLRAQLGTGLRILDLRRPTPGHELPAADASAPAAPVEAWKAPVAVTSSLSVVLALVD